MRATSILIAIVAITISGALLLEPYKISAVEVRTVDSQTEGDANGSMEQQVVAKEREGLDALKTGDLELFGKLTADEAIMVDAQGPATKAQVLKNVGGFKLTEYSMEDIKFVTISPNTGLISYKITEKGVSHGNEFTAKAYVSSIWTRRVNGWVCLFSQETGTK
jgi:hypothetical protein